MPDNLGTEKKDEALTGIKVLELSENISGPYCGKMFAGLGAEVIKIETPGYGDALRKAGPFPANKPHPERSAPFLYLNMRKKGITLDLRTSLGRKIFKKILEDTDVLVENFQPQILPDLELGYFELARIYPRLIMVSISSFGQNGPYRDYRGGTAVEYAISGHTFLNGDPENEPLSPGGEMGAYQAGLHAFTGAMAALHARENSGKGQQVDISVTECLATIQPYTLTRFTYAGVIQKRVGNSFFHTHPTSIYPCRDGYISVNPSQEDQAERMLLAMELAHILEDPRFENGIHRLMNADDFDELVMPWFLERTTREAVEILQEWRVPCALVQNVEALLNDPQYKARDFWVEVDHPEAGSLLYAGAPFKMTETPWRAGRAPLLGEHNREIYRERLGYNRETLVKLRQFSVI